MRSSVKRDFSQIRQSPQDSVAREIANWGDCASLTFCVTYRQVYIRPFLIGRFKSLRPLSVKCHTKSAELLFVVRSCSPESKFLLLRHKGQKIRTNFRQDRTSCGNFFCLVFFLKQILLFSVRGNVRTYRTVWWPQEVNRRPWRADLLPEILLTNVLECVQEKIIIKHFYEEKTTFTS